MTKNVKMFRTPLKQNAQPVIFLNFHQNHIGYSLLYLRQYILFIFLHNYNINHVILFYGTCLRLSSVVSCPLLSIEIKRYL